MALTVAGGYGDAKIRSITGGPVVGQPGEVHTSAQNEIGARAVDQFGNEYIYLKGLAGTSAGIGVVYDEVGATALITDDLKGPVAWATGDTVASTWGWYFHLGLGLALMAANSADNAFLGHETTDGHIGDGRDAGDQIYGVISRQAVTTAAMGLIHVYAYPYVDDIYGS